MREIVGATLRIDFAALRICDVGCGDGSDLEAWHKLGVPEDQLAGTELQRALVTLARDRLPAAEIREVDGFLMPFDDAAFDVTWASMVFSSVLDSASRHMLFSEMNRITRPGGMVAIYDFVVRKPTNRHVAAMTRTRLGTLAGRVPDRRVSVTPFLPALPFALKLPRPIQGMALPLLPRTHAISAWRVR